MPLRRALLVRPSEAVGAIEAVVLHPSMQLGYNGFISYVSEPVVLFKSGDALTSMTGLGDPNGLAANKATHPKHWTTWRRAGSTIEILEGTRWSRPTSQLRGLPALTRLDGRFESASDTGNLTLDPTGRFSIDPAPGATTGGTYDITGYTLTLRHDDGRVETTPIIFTRLRDMFWLDGIAYTKR